MGISFYFIFEIKTYSVEGNIIQALVIGLQAEVSLICIFFINLDKHVVTPFIFFMTPVVIESTVDINKKEPPSKEYAMMKRNLRTWCLKTKKKTEDNKRFLIPFMLFGGCWLTTDIWRNWKITKTLEVVPHKFADCTEIILVLINWGAYENV